MFVAVVVDVDFNISGSANTDVDIFYLEVCLLLL